MKKILIISVLFFLGICSFFQIKVEKYRIDLIKNYNFSYLQQKRVKYTPFVISPILGTLKSRVFC